MKKIITLVACLSLVASLAVGGSIAYLTSTDSADNVMTLGNVKIEQIELQRKDDIAHVGTLNEGDLEDFEQNQLLMPAVPARANDSTCYSAELTDLLKWGPYVTADGAGNGLWDDADLKNTLDKFVFVKNTGKSDAYYRTIIAFECPVGMEYSQNSDKEFMMNINGHNLFDWENVGYATIDGTRHLVMAATYKEILTPGEISRPSLLQVVMTHNATNEDMELLGDTYEILVVSQAVQAAGFADAKTALDTAFGVVSTESHPWMDRDGVTDDKGDQEPDKYTVVNSVADLKEALTNGEDIILADNLDLTGTNLQQMDSAVGATAQSVFSVIGDKDVTINLNGKTLTVDTEGGTNVWTVFYAGNGANLTVEGGGRIEYNSKGRPGGTSAFTTFGSNSVITIKDVEVEQIGEGGVTQMIYAHGAPQDLGKIYVEGGTYIQKQPTSVTNPFYEQGGLNTNIIVSGGTYKVYHDVDLTKYMTLADGYKLELTKTDDDGAKWYTVVAE